MGSTLVFLISTAITIGFGAVFWLAVQTLFNGFGAIVATSLIGEIFSVMSLCLPFSLVQFFGMVSVAIWAIITFLIARKIFNFMMSLIGNAKG